MLTNEHIEKLHEIERLIDEAYDDYITRDPDTYHKSSEGHIEVSLGNYFERSDEDRTVEPSISIYSYVLGPHRSHDFDSFDQALETVRVWHRNQLNTVYDAGGGWYVKDEQPDPYIELENKRHREREEFFRYMDENYGFNEEDD